MTNPEFSNAFTTLLNSYNVPADFGNQSSRMEIVLDEYEKSLYLTMAQEQLVVSYYSGKNVFGDSFESTEEMRRQLDSLVKTKVYTVEDEVGERIGVNDKSIFFNLPERLAFITMEQVTFNDRSLGCLKNSESSVYPVRQDEYSKIKNNPFRGATKYKVLRIDTGDNMVELVSKYTISKYLIKYIEKPEPIILENLPSDLSIDGQRMANECKLNSILHSLILERAVLMALRAKGINTNTGR